MDKAIKKEAYTRAGKLTVDASEKGGRIVRASTNSISRAEAFVKRKKEDFDVKKRKIGQKLREFFYVGERYAFKGDDEYDRMARKIIRMKRFKRILACAFIAICATVVLLCSGVIVQIFIGGAV